MKLKPLLTAAARFGVNWKLFWAGACFGGIVGMIYMATLMTLIQAGVDVAKVAGL